MNEIEKLYENAGIENELQGFHCHRNWDICENEYKCKICKYSELIYSVPFTAEKQLLLIQWLLNRADLYLHKHKSDFTYSIASGNYAVNKYRDLKKSIAEFINAIWQSLTEEEKQQVKGILE